MEDVRADEIARIAAKLSHELQRILQYAVLYYLPINYKFGANHSRHLRIAQDGHDAIVITIPVNTEVKDLLPLTERIGNVKVSYFFRSGNRGYSLRTLNEMQQKAPIDEETPVAIVFCALNAMDELMRYRVDRRPPYRLYTVGRKNWRMYLNNMHRSMRFDWLAVLWIGSALIMAIGYAYARVMGAELP